MEMSTQKWISRFKTWWSKAKQRGQTKFDARVGAGSSGQGTTGDGAMLSGKSLALGGGNRSVVPRRQGRGDLLVQCAHKKGAGSTKNGRDSNSKRLGVKVRQTPFRGATTHPPSSSSSVSLSLSLSPTGQAPPSPSTSTLYARREHLADPVFLFFFFSFCVCVCDDASSILP